MAQPLKSERGQALVEGALISLVMITGLGILGVALSLAFSTLWVDHVAYRGVLCLSEYPKRHCQKQVIKKLQKPLLTDGEVLDVDLKEYGHSSWECKIKWKSRFFDKRPMVFHHRLTRKGLRRLARRRLPDLLW